MELKRLLLVVMVLFAWTRPMIAMEPEVLIMKASAAFSKAIEADSKPEKQKWLNMTADYYKKLLDFPDINRDAAFYNLGTVYAQADQPGLAVYYLKKSLRYFPENLAARHNLKAVLQEHGLPYEKLNAEVADLIAEQTEGSRSIIPITIGVLSLLFWGAVGISRFWRKPILNIVAGLSGVLLLLSGGYYMGTRASLFQAEEGVVLLKNTSIYQGPGYSYPKASQEGLKEGISFAIEKKRGDWVMAKENTGRMFWIPEDSIGLIR